MENKIVLKWIGIGSIPDVWGWNTHYHIFLPSFFPFLKYWNVLLQLLYFCDSALDGINRSNDKTKRKTVSFLLQRFKYIIFSNLAFPVSTLATTSLWTMYGETRELIFPLFFDKSYPRWANQMVHTTCMDSQLNEMTMVFRVFPSTKTGIMTTIGFYLRYLTWILDLAFNKRVWIYHSLQKLPAIGKTVFTILFGVIVFTILFGVVGGMLFVVGVTLNGMIRSRYAAGKLSSKQH